MTDEYEYRVQCGDGTMWDYFPDDVAEARGLIDEWGQGCGCEKGKETHQVVRRPRYAPPWEVVDDQE